jgi:hypothetical protein
LKTGVLRLLVRARDVSQRAPSTIAKGTQLVVDHHWQGFVFMARPPRGWRAAILNARASRLSSEDLTITVGNAPGARGVFTGAILVRMSGSRVDGAIQQINRYYDSGPTLSQVIALGVIAVAGRRQPATPEEICRPFLGMATQIVAA